jgi:lysozyme family protein
MGKGPYSSWHESAVDALSLEKSHIESIDISDGWSLSECLWFAMRYNGTGYQSRNLNSPYVFAGTNAYVMGGFPRDHFFDPNFVVTNLGAFAILWAIKEVQGYLDVREVHDVVKITYDIRGDFNLESEVLNG